MVNTLNANEEAPKIPIDLLHKYEYRTRKLLKQRELMLQYSKASSLVIVTLPLAPQPVLMSPLYMLWLELLSKSMPPTLYVRGNNHNVLTFYS
jgi:hypothetical protein